MVFRSLLLLVFLCCNVVASADSIPHASSARLEADVAALVGTDKPRNIFNLESLNQAADYIKAELEKTGLRVEEQQYDAEGKLVRNIIASYGPEDAERLVVGAHYDVCYNQPGADDNGSGTAGLIELARMLGQHQPALDYRIDLVAYTLEEPPFFRSDLMGSAVHAKSLHDAQVAVKGMICLEMIGYFDENRKSQSYPIGCMKWIYGSRGDYIALVGKLGKGSWLRKVRRRYRKASGVKQRSILGPTIVPGIDFSDHRNYWKYGYKAVMITDTAFYRNYHYHEPTDTLDRLDFGKMAEVVNGVYNAMISL